MDLHMRQFDGTTFGMDVQDKAAFKVMKKNVFRREVTPKRRVFTIKTMRVGVKDLAAVMGMV